MKKLLLALAMVAATTTAFASSSLVGAWKSNHDLTMSYATSHARLSPRAEHVIDQMMGRLTLRFEGSRVSYELPDWDAEIDGKYSHLVGAHETSDYEILFSNDNTVAVKGRQLVTGKEMVTVYNFVDANTMWIYLGSNDKGMLI